MAQPHPVEELRSSPGTRRASGRWCLWLCIVWLPSAAYMASLLLRGWVPHDEGTFAQSASRVLAGELPHRDFDELYTGGLTYLNAFAFRVLGVNLASLRVPLFACFLAWVPAVYAIASRFVAPPPAAATTLLAVAWSLPNYAAPVPSWYNLFFATFGLLALLRYLERPAPWLLGVAGLCGGFSFLAKSPGLYYVAAAVLFLVFRGQCLARHAAGDSGARAPAYRAFATVGLGAFIVALLAMVGSSGGVPALVQFALPGATLATLVLVREWRGVPSGDARRFLELFGMLLPLGIGLALPLALFAVPYAASGSMADLADGLWCLPMKRLSFASMDLPPLSSGIAIVPFIAALGAARGPRWLRRTVSAIAAVGLAAVLVLSRTRSGVYAFAWHSLDLLPPLTVVAGALLVSRGANAAAGFPLRRQQVMLVLCVMALANVVRFPFSAPIYFCYVAPLVALAVLAVLSSIERLPRVIVGSFAAFYLLFAVTVTTPSFIYAMGIHYQPDPQTQPLRLPRAGGLRVSPREAAQYEQLIPLVRQHAAGDYVYAGNDCPEVYFLAGLKNPRRVMFEFFEPPEGRTERILDAIDAKGVTVVAILGLPPFSRPDRELEAALAERFPQAQTVARFRVRWRSPRGASSSAQALR